MHYRIVPLDFLLKDVPDNRDLQSRLFEEAKQNKNRKKTQAAARPKEDAPKAVESPSASGSEQEDTEVLLKVQLEKGDAEDNDGDDVDGENDADDGEEDEPPLVPLELRAGLKRHLEEDMDRTVKRRRFNPLPARPSVVDVLEAFVRHFAAKQVNLHANRHSGGKSKGDSNKDDGSIERVADAVNVCQEVAEGLRVMVDFYAGDELVYENEAAHFRKAMKSREAAEALANAVAEDRKAANNDDVDDDGIEVIKVLEKPSPPPPPQPPKGRKPRTTAAMLQRRRDSATGIITIDLTGHRFAAEAASSSRLSSRDSTTSGRSTPSVSDPIVAVPAASLSARATQIVDSANSWRLLPPSASLRVRDPIASVVCGPVYLLRLCCRLPEILGKMGMKERKTRLVVKFLDALLDYLDEQRADLFKYLYE